MRFKLVKRIILLTFVSVLLLLFASFVGGEMYLYDVVFIEPEIVQSYVGEYLQIIVGFGYGFEIPHPPVIEFSLGWDASLLDFIDLEICWDSPTVVVGDDHMNVTVSNPRFSIDLIGIVFQAKAVGSTTLDLFDSNVYTSDGFVFILPLPPLPIAVHNINTGLNYTTVQGAINAQETMDGHTILVDSGIYFEHVVVNKSITLIGENKSNTIIDGMRNGTVIHITANNVTIIEFTIQNSGRLGSQSGIYVYGSSDNNICHNILTNNKYGIKLDWANNNSLRGNVVSGAEYGIQLSYYSSNNIISGNTAINNLFGGICLNGNSGNNIIAYNNVSLNGRGILLGGFGNNTIYDNNVSSNSGDGILLSSSNNVLYSNIISSNGYYGIRFYRSNNNILYGNNASNNVEGIMVYESNYNNFTSNTASFNAYGIHLVYYSKNNVLTGNTVLSNGDGIRLIQSCDKNTLVFNNVSLNSEHGIRLWNSFNNVLTGNTVLKNSYGILFEAYSSNNVFFHNNFINNTQQVNSDGSPNTWDNGYPSGGNYWSDYTGKDLYYGPHQNLTGADGIGDDPYTINADNQDRYPLMNPWVVHLTADFTYSPLRPVENETITFDASTSLPGWNGTHATSIVSYAWDFGDGTPIITEANTVTTHNYTAVGNYTVTLNVTDSQGLWNTTSKTITVRLPTHDVVIDNVTPAKTVVGQGYKCKINVTAENRGDFQETFTVTVYYQNVTYTGTIGTPQNVTNLAPGAKTTLTFTLDTTGVQRNRDPGYTIFANVTVFPSETDTDDNTYTDGTVKVVIPGNINADNQVNVLDVGKLGVHWLAKVGEPLYNANVDINGDGRINVLDLGILGVHWLEEDLA